MSWQNELFRVYERYSGCEMPDNTLLPVSHSTANAQIQITLDEEGNFVSARTLTKDEAETVIPVTEDSGARSSGIAPMPFADKLVYIAGDYVKYATGKKADNSDYFSAYINQLKKWKESEFSHPAVNAVYVYLSKKEVMQDLVNCGVLKCNEETGKLQDHVKIAGIAQEDSFVRFCVNYADLGKTDQTWKDQSLQESFISFNSSTMKNVQLCYATGKELPVTFKHPSKIRNSGDKAKLFSSNDESGFTYRGRFKNKEEAISISYDFSQKMHNALKWIIARQGMSFDTMTFVVWEENMTPLPDIRQEPSRWNKGNEKEEVEDVNNTGVDDFDFDEMEEFEDDMVIGNEPQYRELLQQMIFSYKNKLETNTKIMFLGLDAATTGRLSVAMYSELAASDFYHNLEKWHLDTAALRYNYKKRGSEVRSFSVYEIINSAFGTEQNEKLVCDKKILSKTILRLFSCMTEKKALPEDIVRNLYHKASNPLAYEKFYNHRIVLETACGMIRKRNIEKKETDDKKGVTDLAYNPNETSRDYLYGCLLAIADKTERDTYNQEDKDKRVTNARRYWNMFSQRPYQTWQKIEEHLIPYLDKMETEKERIRYEKRIQEITDKMTVEEFRKNEALKPEYLLGYHHYMAYMYSKKKEENKNECITE